MARACCDYFRSRTLNEVDAVKTQALIRQLGDESFEVRENASARLAAWAARPNRFCRMP